MMTPKCPRLSGFEHMDGQRILLRSSSLYTLYDTEIVNIDYLSSSIYTIFDGNLTCHVLLFYLNQIRSELLNQYMCIFVLSSFAFTFSQRRRRIRRSSVVENGYKLIMLGNYLDPTNAFQAFINSHNHIPSLSVTIIHY